MIKLALLGKNISHSKSKQVYEKILDQEIDYTLIDSNSEDEIPSLASVFRQNQGLSITSPYKNHYIGAPETKLCFTSFPAVNCVKGTQSNQFELYNTDYLAVFDILNDFIKNHPKGLDIVILGGGNMSQITQLALGELDQKYRVLTRSDLKAELNSVDYRKLFAQSSARSMLINTCSRSFVFHAKIPADLLFWDQNYSLKQHQEVLSMKCEYHDGMGLLYKQAEEALHIWGLL